MDVKQVNIEEFITLCKSHPILDVRSPGEYAHAHIPGAISFPLFTDDERAIVGTLYKQESKEKAIRKGLEFFGPKLNQLLDKAECIIEQFNSSRGRASEQKLLVHCWRGGMRSAGVAWLLRLYGFEIITLQGGYKAYRKWVLAQFDKKWNFLVVGGFTGSSKTESLCCLSSIHNEKVIDLELLARHKGSAFGGIGQSEPQPTQEMFENRLAGVLYNIYNHDDKEEVNVKSHIWVEDESQRIGSVNIPQPLYNQLRTSKLLFLHIPFGKRLEYIVSIYGKLDRSLIIAAISRLQKKMGGLETKESIGFLLEGDIENSFQILLRYYDRLYEKALNKKKVGLLSLTTIPIDFVDPQRIAVTLIKHKPYE